MKSRTTFSTLIQRSKSPLGPHRDQWDPRRKPPTQQEMPQRRLGGHERLSLSLSLLVFFLLISSTPPSLPTSGWLFVTLVEPKNGQTTLNFIQIANEWEKKRPCLHWLWLAVIAYVWQGRIRRAFRAFPGRPWRRTQDSVGHKTDDKREKKKEKKWVGKGKNV